MSAISDYVEAVEHYHKVLDKYFRLVRILNGDSVIAGDPLTSLARRELREANDKISEIKKKLEL